MKKHKKLNRTKVIVLFIIALLGLYVISIKSESYLRPMSSTNQRVTVEDLKNQMKMLGAQMRGETNPIKKAQLAAKIAVLNEQIRFMEAAQRRVMVPKS